MANTLKLGAGKWATGKDTVLSFNDENGNFKPLAFSFSRASSATVVNQSGLIETVGSGEPRIDFKDNTEGALLLEPQRTNNLLQSNQFDTTWVIGASALNLTSGQSGVGGSNNAWLLKKNTTGARFLQQLLSLSSAQYSYSVYMKAESTNWALLWCYDGTNDAEAYFDLENGVVGNTSGANLDNVTIESVGNGWYRCTLIYTQATTLVRIYPAYSNGSVSTAPDSGIFIQYSQLEQGSYPTSYIPTSGQSGGVTRVRDLSDTQNLSHVIGQTEGVIFYDAILVHKSKDTSEDLFELSIDDGSNQNIFFINNYNNSLTVGMLNGGSYEFTNNSFNPTEGARYKLGFAYKQNDFALYINGNQIATDSSGTVPSMNQITFGNYYNNQFNLSNSVKVNDFKLYNTRLSNAELQALTTI